MKIILPIEKDGDLATIALTRWLWRELDVGMPKLVAVLNITAPFSPFLTLGQTCVHERNGLRADSPTWKAILHCSIFTIARAARHG